MNSLLRATLGKLGWLTAASLLIAASVVSQTNAGSYDVNARVNFPAPTQAAVIDSDLDNVTVENALFTIEGACEIGSPNFIVSIVRNSVAIGSANCDANGRFSVDVSLSSGLNTLIARSASISHLYGPDSSPINVTLNLPPPVTPTDSSNPTTPESGTPTTNTNTPGSSSAAKLTPQQYNAINQGARKNLRINTTEAFSVINEDKSTSIDVIVEGGNSPYTITINWGDGSVDSKVVDQPGKYTFTHIYNKIASYRVTGEVRDVVGAITKFDYVVSTFKNSPIAANISSPATPSSFKPQNSLDYFTIMMVSAFGIVSFASFYLGKASGHHFHKTIHKKKPRSV